MIETLERNVPFLADFEPFERNLTLGGPAWLPRARKEAIRRYAALGLPTTRNEDWRYTDLRPIRETAFRLTRGYASGGLDAAALSRLVFDVPQSHKLVFVNGHFSGELSDAGKLPAGVLADSLGACLASDVVVETHLAHAARHEDHPFVALNTAFLKDGALVHVPKGVALERPIHLIFLGRSEGEGREPAVFHPRNLIVLEESSSAIVVESHAGEEGEVYLTNSVTEIVLGENARLEHYKINRDSTAAFHVAVQQARQARASALYSLNLTFGGRLVRNEVRTVLDGEGADAVIDGLYLGSGRRHIDHQTLVDHAASHCTSNELYKGILDEDATSAFHGKVFVQENAQKTDARQTNRNLLLSDRALATTKPQLEIYADDVKCTHGATVGQIDLEALFYLRSRGIAQEEARSLLTLAFANDIIRRIRYEPLRERLEEDLPSRLSRGGSAGS